MDLSERGGDAGRSRHPWERSRARFFRRLVALELPLHQVKSVLDVGAGDGWLAAQLVGDLEPAAHVTCWDVNYTGEDLRQDLPDQIERVLQAPSGPFDLVLALDVLEHIAEDEAFLTDEIVPRLAPGGTLVASVPVHPSLFVAHDEALGHHRRYRSAAFVDMVGRHLDVRRHGSLFASLLAPRAAVAGLERLGRRSRPQGIGGWRGGPRLTAAATGLLDADARLGLWTSRRGLALPGLSHWVVATKRGD